MFNSTDSAKANYSLLFAFYFLPFALLLSTGCSGEQQAVQLYVDAVMLNELDENEKAIEKLNSAVQINKRFSLAYSLLGDIFLQIKDYEKSAASYEKATRLNPWSFRDYFNLGRAYQVLKRFAHAVKAYARACELKPDHLDAHINTAKCYYEIEDYDLALMYGQRAEQIEPDVSEIQKLLGDIYKSQRDYDQAIRLYRRALEIDSNNPDIMTSLAVAYMNINHNNWAKELLTSAIQIQPDNNTAHQYLGYCYLRFYGQASQAYRDMLKKAGDNTKALTSLKEDVARSIDGSIKSYSRAIEINNRDWQSHRGLGVAYVLKARADEDKTLRARAVQQWHLSLDIKSDQPNRERLLKLIRIYSR